MLFLNVKYLVKLYNLPNLIALIAAPLNMPEYVTINRTTDGTLGVNFRGVVTGPNEEPLDGYKV